MTIVRFGTFYANRHDRGAHNPLYIYEAELPKDVDAAKWLDRVSAGYGKAAAIAGDFLATDSQAQVYVDTRTDLVAATREDDDWRMVLGGNTFESTTVRSISAVPETAARQILTDMFAVWFLDEVFTKTEKVNWKSIWKELDATPKRIAIGTPVYAVQAAWRTVGEEFIYGGLREPAAVKGQIVGPEESFVPVEFVATQNPSLEAFPLPSFMKKRAGGWWARSKDNPKIEATGRVKKDALHTVSILSAHDAYWKAS